MGLTKQYLRYLSSAQLGVVASTSSNAIFLTLRGEKTRYVAAASCEHVNIWDIRTSKKMVVLQGGKQEVTCISRSPDNTHIAVGYTDGSINIYNLLTGDIVVTFNGHKSAISCLSYDKNGMMLSSGSRDTEVVVWDLVNESGLYRLKGHKDIITNVIFLETKNMLISCSKDTFVKWWDLDTQHCFKTMVGHRGAIWGMVLTADDKYLITGSTDSELRIWQINFDVAPPDKQVKAKLMKLDDDKESNDSEESDEERDNEEINERLVMCKRMGSILRKSTDRVMSMQISKNGQILACHGNKRDVEVFRIRNEEELNLHIKKKSKKMRKRQKDESDDGNFVIELTAEDVMFPMGTFKCQAKCRFVDIQFDRKDDFKILSTTINNQVEVYTATTESGHLAKEVEPVAHLSLHGHRTDPRSLMFSKDGLIYASVSIESAKIWNRSSQQCICTVKCGAATCLTFTPGDRQVLIGTKTGKIEIIDIASAQLLETVDCDEDSVTCMSLYSDRYGLATGGNSKVIKFWEFCLITDKEYSQNEKRLSIKLKRKLKLDDEITGIEFSNNGKLIGVALADCSVKVFYVDSLKFFLSLYGHSLPVTSMSMSSDSTIIATGSADRNLKIWGLDFGDCHKSIFAHDDTVTSVRFIPDTHMLLTSGKDGSIKQWDADKFILIQSLIGHQGPVWDIAIDHEGEYIASCGKDKSVRLWSKSEEIVLPDEERENEREEEDEMRLAKNQETIIPGEAESEETGMASKITISTIKGTERIMEAVDIYREETIKIKDHDEITKASKHEIPPRIIHPVLQAFGNISPERYVLNVLEKVKRSDLDESLLVLSFSYVPDLLELLNMFVTKAWNVELSCRCIFFLLRIHYGQIISNKMMVPLLENLQKSTEDQVGQLRDVLGFNITAMKHMKRELENKREAIFFADATEKFKEKNKKKKVKSSTVSTI